MEINRKLDLVIPIERGDTKIYVHGTAISREVFEANVLVISKTFATIWEQGLRHTVGPRVAAVLLKKVAQDMGVWEGEGGTEQSLMAEIRRLSNVVRPGPKGWDIITLQEAIDTKYLSEDEIAEAEGQLVFFTLESCLRPKSQLAGFLGPMTRFWGSRITSQSFTEFVDSLPTSTPAANTGAKAKASSIPA